MEPSLKCDLHVQSQSGLITAAATAAAITATAHIAVRAAEATFAAATEAAFTTTTAAEATFVTITTTTTEATTTAAWRTSFHRTGFVHHQATSTQRLTIHTCDGLLRFGIAAHFNKAKTFRAACVTLHHDFGAADATKSTERLLQIFIAHRIRKVADVKFVAHQGTPENT